MKLAIMQPYFFPYLGYFQAIHAVDKYILYDNLNFIKEAWMHRNRFLVKNENPAFFYVELRNKSSYNKIYEVELIENASWRKRIINGIFLNYKKTPYFEEVFPLLESVVNYPTSKLTELNYQSIYQVCNYLELTTKIESSPDKYTELEMQLSKEVLDEKYFNDIAVNSMPRKVIRVLSICRNENADIFINAIGGMELYNKDMFQKNGIKLLFVNTLDYTYKQQSQIFHPHLSIIDILMNRGKEGTTQLIKNYELI